MGNPVKLLNNILKPTRGINTNIYYFFNLDLGVFDLAGHDPIHHSEYE